MFTIYPFKNWIKVICIVALFAFVSFSLCFAEGCYGKLAVRAAAQKLEGYGLKVDQLNLEELNSRFPPRRGINREQRKLRSRIFSIGYYLGIEAHGVTDISLEDESSILGFDRIKLLNIMLEGEIRPIRDDEDEVSSGLLTEERPQYDFPDLTEPAGEYGDYYVLLTQDAPSAERGLPSIPEHYHGIYLVPGRDDKLFFEAALEQAVQRGILTPERKSILSNKIITYEEFLQEIDQLKYMSSGQLVNLRINSLFSIEEGTVEEAIGCLEPDLRRGYYAEGASILFNGRLRKIRGILRELEAVSNRSLPVIMLKRGEHILGVAMDVEQARNALVGVLVELPAELYGKEFYSLASGVIYEQDTQFVYILTTAEIPEEVREVKVFLETEGNQFLTAEVVAIGRYFGMSENIARLALPRTSLRYPESVATIPLADSSEVEQELLKGCPAFTLGNNFRSVPPYLWRTLDPSIPTKVERLAVAGKAYRHENRRFLAIETETATFEEFYGGPVINEDGKIIGIIHTLPVGVSLAIDIASIHRFLDMVKTNEILKVVREAPTVKWLLLHDALKERLLGEQLRLIREMKSIIKGRSLTAEEVAGEIGIGRATLSRIETGQIPYQDFNPHLIKLADYYNISRGVLLLPLSLYPIEVEEGGWDLSREIRNASTAVFLAQEGVSLSRVIGHRLKLLRIIKGWERERPVTHQEIAREIYSSRSTSNRIETGAYGLGSRAYQERLHELADYYGVRFEDVVASPEVPRAILPDEPMVTEAAKRAS